MAITIAGRKIPEWVLIAIPAGLGIMLYLLKGPTTEEEENISQPSAELLAMEFSQRLGEFRNELAEYLEYVLGDQQGEAAPPTTPVQPTQPVTEPGAFDPSRPGPMNDTPTAPPETPRTVTVTFQRNEPVERVILKAVEARISEIQPTPYTAPTSYEEALERWRKQSEIYQEEAKKLRDASTQSTGISFRGETGQAPPMIYDPALGAAPEGGAIPYGGPKNYDPSTPPALPKVKQGAGALQPPSMLIKTFVQTTSRETKRVNLGGTPLAPGASVKLDIVRKGV